MGATELRYGSLCLIHGTLSGILADDAVYQGAPLKTYIIMALSLLLLSSSIPAAADGGKKPPFTVVKAVPCPEVTSLFTRSKGWTGSDGAYSIPMGSKKTLWLFGDTYIGTITDGKRIDSPLINNTAALQQFSGKSSSMKFFWHTIAGKPAALFTPGEKNAYYWPGDGMRTTDKLFLFMKKIRPLPDGPPGFQFQWFGDDILMIDNPDAETLSWNYRRIPFPPGEESHWGTACARSGNYLFFYGCRDINKERQVLLARIAIKELEKADLSKLQFWCGASGWQDKVDRSEPLFHDGATEMTVSCYPGIRGFVAIYTPMGIGPRVLLRHSLSPEGPWSEPLELYTVPDAEGLLLYGAKGHPELSTVPGKLIVTYCRNAGSLEEDIIKPWI